MPTATVLRARTIEKRRSPSRLLRGSRSLRTATADDEPEAATDPGWVIETVVSPFHCLYQDALYFHTQSRLAQSEGDAAPAGAGRFPALRLQRRGPGAPGRRRAGPARAARLARRSQPAAAPGRGLAALAGDRRRARRAHPLVRSRGCSLAPVRRAAHARDLVGLSGTSLQPPGLLPLDPPRQRLRAARAAPRTSPRCSARSAPRRSLSLAPACRATPTLCALATSIPRAAFLTPPSKPLTAAWAAPLCHGPAPPPRAGPRGLSRADREWDERRLGAARRRGLSSPT